MDQVPLRKNMVGGGRWVKRAKTITARLRFSAELWMSLSNIIVSFQFDDIDYDKMKIDAYLKARVDMRKIKPPLDIEGKFMLNYTDDTIDLLNKTTIRVSSVYVYNQLKLLSPDVL